MVWISNGIWNPEALLNDSYLVFSIWNRYYLAYTVGIWISNFLKFGFQMGSPSLCPRPTIWIPDQYIRKEYGIHLSGIQMVGLSGIQMTFKNQTIWHPTSFWPFKYQTSSVFRYPLYCEWVELYWTTSWIFTRFPMHGFQIPTVVF